MANLEAGDWADVMTDQLYHLLLQLLGVDRVASLDGDKSNWNLTLEIIIDSNDNGFGDMGALHDDFFHFASGEAMAGSVDDVINSGHDVEISIFVIES